MKIILTQNIERLGKPGDIATVKEGYARNFLFPKNMAKEATAGNMKILEAMKKKQSLQEEKRVKEAKVIADKLSSLSLTINVQAGEEEKLFGSVTADMIAQALASEGYSIDKKDILLDEPIKKLGVYQVTAKIHPEVKATIRVWVVKE